MEKSIIIVAVGKVFWMTEVKARVVGSRELEFWTTWVFSHLKDLRGRPIKGRGWTGADAGAYP